MGRYRALGSYATHSLCVNGRSGRGGRYRRTMRERAFQRARSKEHKQQRAVAMLDAARSVAGESGVAAVTLTAIAERAGVHHSAVGRYYTSYKEVLLLLGQEGWDRWSKAVCDSLHASGQVVPARVAQIMAEYFNADPLFCDLLCNLPLHLEREVDVAQVLEFRRSSLDAIQSVIDAIRLSCPLFDEQAAIDAVASACALAAIFWQNAHPPTELIDALGGDPMVTAWKLDFESALTRVLAATCIGLTARG